MWGIVPAAGAGTRIQPLAFSKELLPVGSWQDGTSERPRAVSEYLVERMILAGADRICFVIAPGKSDILEYYGARGLPVRVCYTFLSSRPTSSSSSGSRTRSGFPKMRSEAWATIRSRSSSSRWTRPSGSTRS